MSMQRFCAITETKPGKWILRLAPDEYDGEEKAINYGPFKSLEEAEEALNDFTNPGAYFVQPYRRAK